MTIDVLWQTHTEAKMIDQIMTDAGYRLHRCESYRSFKMTDMLYQKSIEDANGIRYFVNAWYYPTVGSVQYEVDFYDHLDQPYLRIVLLNQSGPDPSAADEEIAKLATSLKVGYYERKC